VSLPDKKWDAIPNDQAALLTPRRFLTSIVQAVAVLVVNLRPIRTEVFVHVNLRTVNPSNRVGRPLSILICVPVMSLTL
jgi:hypothetical protein